MKTILHIFAFCFSLLSLTLTSYANADNTKTATFAGGCFWCMEPPFDKLEGVISTTSGYTGGHVKNPSYKQVSSGKTGHTEAVQIAFDPEKVSYAELLEVFWHNIDPLDASGQFCDKGDQYRSEIFYHNENQQRLAKESLSKLQQLDKFKQQNIATRISKATTFYPAETYHQDYYKKNPLRYKFYRYNCGRDRVLKSYWPEE